MKETNVELCSIKNLISEVLTENYGEKQSVSANKDVFGGKCTVITTKGTDLKNIPYETYEIDDIGGMITVDSAIVTFYSSNGYYDVAADNINLGNFVRSYLTEDNYEFIQTMKKFKIPFCVD